MDKKCWSLFVGLRIPMAFLQNVGLTHRAYILQPVTLSAASPNLIDEGIYDGRNSHPEKHQQRRCVNLFSLIVFTFVLVTGNLVKLADLVINKGVDISKVGKLFLFLIPFLLSYTIPMSTLSATLLVFGRLSSDNEILALRANGVSLSRLTSPLIIAGVILSLFSVVLNNRILPESHFASRKIVKNIGIKNPTAYLESGTFIKSFKDYIIFIHEIDKQKLNKIRIYQLQEGSPARTIIAKKCTKFLH